MFEINCFIKTNTNNFHLLLFHCYRTFKSKEMRNELKTD
jgi:hypothetical protein